MLRAAVFMMMALATAVVVVDGHVYLMEPTSRNFFHTTAFQSTDFEGLTYCPHCLQSRGPAAVAARALELTSADALSSYGDGAWPHLTAYNRGELGSNGNFLENDEISVRHGICGDPEQTSAEGTNVFGQENSVYPVLETYQEGSVIEMKVVVSTYHWGHFEFHLCNSENLSDPDGPVTQGCFNMQPLDRAEDDGDASPIDPDHPGRYFVDPPCRAAETDQTMPEGAQDGYVVTGRYRLPEGLTCKRCIVQMVYYTGHVCTLPGYDDFEPDSLPDGCWSDSDWLNLNPPACGEGEAYPEEFWNCADIEIVSGGSSSSSGSGGSPSTSGDEQAHTPSPSPSSSSSSSSPAAYYSSSRQGGDEGEENSESLGGDDATPQEEQEGQEQEQQQEEQQEQEQEQEEQQQQQQEEEKEQQQEEEEQQEEQQEQQEQQQQQQEQDQQQGQEQQDSDEDAAPQDEELEDGGSSPCHPVEVLAAQVAASVSTQETNPAANAVDGSLETRWSAEGRASWLVIDLPVAASLSAVELAFEDGDQRTQDFEIVIMTQTDVSTTFYTSSGKTNDRQQFSSFADGGSLVAETVVIVGYGNSLNDWNSFTEIKLCQGDVVSA